MLVYKILTVLLSNRRHRARRPGSSFAPISTTCFPLFSFHVASVLTTPNRAKAKLRLAVCYSVAARLQRIPCSTISLLGIKEVTSFERLSY